MRLVDVKDIKQGFMKETDLDEQSIQIIIDELPTANCAEKTELEMYKRKLKKLKELKDKEPNNTYHDWDKEIAQCEHNIAECICEID